MDSERLMINESGKEMCLTAALSIETGISSGPQEALFSKLLIIFSISVLSVGRRTIVEFIDGGKKSVGGMVEAGMALAR